MKTSLILACLWVFAATLIALLPVRRQVPLGVVLLVVAFGLIIWIGLDYGLWPALLGLAGFLSMFRRPLLYFGRRALGFPTSTSKSEERP